MLYDPTAKIEAANAKIFVSKAMDIVNRRTKNLGLGLLEEMLKYPPEVEYQVNAEVDLEDDPSHHDCLEALEEKRE